MSIWNGYAFIFHMAFSNNICLFAYNYEASIPDLDSKLFKTHMGQLWFYGKYSAAGMAIDSHLITQYHSAEFMGGFRSSSNAKRR